MEEKKMVSIANEFLDKMSKEKLTYEEAENVLQYASCLLKQRVFI